MYKLKDEYNQISINDSSVFRKDVDYKDAELSKIPKDKIEEYFVKFDGRKEGPEEGGK